ncbi:MAG TPA: sialate O-acetylesterase [Luteolibacter sp.]|nr:sialate O-acetylesterase [Luteolibacter sp.]
MKNPSLSHFTLGLTLSLLLLAQAGARTWTSSDGSKTFEGELHAYDEAAGKVTVIIGGKEVTFRQDLLSPADVAFVKENISKVAAAPAEAPAAPGAVATGALVGAAAGTKVNASLPDKLPDPDGKDADMSKPVQVFIMMGQSNMLGFGNVAQLKGIAAEKYPYVIDDAGSWTVRKDVRNIFFCSGKQNTNDWLSVGNRGAFGPEIGIGNYLGHAIDAPVMLLKCCIGNRALGWDLLPPSAVGTGTGGKSYEGNSEYGNRKLKEPRDGWYAGLQYDQDVGDAQGALRNLATYYPGATKYEVAGFFWWQGCSEGKGNPETYDKNLAFLFSDLKKDFNAPNAKFVGATLGEHEKDAPLAQKMFAFADAHKGNAAFFYAKPVSKGGSCGHYGKDAETYMNVGEGMGKLMVELLGK